MTTGTYSRVRTMGVRGASLPDLVTLGTARREEDADGAQGATREMLQRFGGVARLADLSPEDLRDAYGLEGFESLRCLALIEVGRRIGGAGKGPVTSVECASDVMDLLDFLRGEKREHFIAVLLDAKNNVLRTATIHIGTLTMSVVGAREVFREAIREGASAIIVAHNHPSGDPTPSPEDIDVTAKLAEVGRMLDIPVLDHIIIGERRYVSLQERGVI